MTEKERERDTEKGKKERGRETEKGTKIDKTRERHVMEREKIER
jgi:hypothetical protein